MVKKHLILTMVAIVSTFMLVTLTTISSTSPPLGIHQSDRPLANSRLRISDLSPDGRMLYLDYCDLMDNCRVGWVDLTSKKFVVIEPQNVSDLLSSPSSADNGKTLALVIKDVTKDHEISQIGILDFASNTYRAVTSSSTMKEWPSFSHDGKKIIYGQANRIRKEGKTKYSEWDIYEIDLATGIERRLTEFCFFLISRPQYLSNNESFAFSGEEPACNFPSPNTSYGHEGYSKEDYNKSQNGRTLYRQLYGRNWNFIMSDYRKLLKPIVITGEWSGGATLSREENKLFYLAITNNMDGSKDFGYHYDLFVYEDGKSRRLTDLKTMITGFAVSTRGDQVAFQIGQNARNVEGLWILDVDTNLQKKIHLNGLGNFKVLNVTNN